LTTLKREEYCEPSMGATIHPGEGGRPSSNHERPAPPPPLLLAAAEKQAAVQQVIQSNAFLRADQLRSFLRYICEMEIAGRAAELSEYLIGVEALGRSPGYSTADDSSVRRQAHALRQKLDEAYATELAGAAVRIELPKGSYVPRFVGNAAAHPPCDAGAESEPPEAAPVGGGKRAGVRRTWASGVATAAFAAGALTTMTALWMTGTLNRDPLRRRQPTPVLAEAWGPLAQPGANILICLATPPHLVILPYPEEPLPPLASVIPPLPQEPDLRGWFRQHYPLEPTDTIGIHKTTGPIHLGDVNGLVTTVRFLDQLGVNFQIVAEKNMSLPALRGRNLMLIGNPEYSYAASTLLGRVPWTIAYDASTRQRVVRRRERASPNDPVYAPVRDARGWLSDVFGLITVFPSEGAPEASPMRTVIFSCTNDSGCQAAIEFFASTPHMGGLLARLQQRGRAGFPSSYQVVVRSKVQSAQTISAEYADHVVLP
jgi:hypothetical protein